MNFESYRLNKTMISDDMEIIFGCKFARHGVGEIFISRANLILAIKRSVLGKIVNI
jgi:hypothetical protein